MSVSSRGEGGDQPHARQKQYDIFAIDLKDGIGRCLSQISITFYTNYNFYFINNTYIIITVVSRFLYVYSDFKFTFTRNPEKKYVHIDKRCKQNRCHTTCFYRNVEFRGLFLYVNPLTLTWPSFEGEEGGLDP